MQVLPIDDECDLHPGRQIAFIREQDCIGCTLCLDPCPVDAIVGAAKHMHTVVSHLCTGCRLCVPYCPVDCIEMFATDRIRPGSTWNEFDDDEVAQWRALAARHFDRIEDQPNSEQVAETEELRQEIREAVNRTRSKRWKKTRKTSALNRTSAGGGQ